MTLLRRAVARPGLPVAVVAAVCLVLLERSVTGALLGLIGVALGTLGALAALQVGLLVGALATRVRIHRVVLGAGRRVREWRSPRHVVVLRAVPIALQVAIGPGRAPVRLRMWLTALVSVLITAAATAALGLLVDGPIARGAAIAGVAVLLHALAPRSDASSTSTGWLLLRLPRLSPRRVAELEVAPVVDQALAEVNAGELDAAAATAGRLADAHPDLRATRAVLVTVLEARGRYAEAVAQALGMVGLPDQNERDLSLALAGLAGLAAAAAEAGQVEEDAGLGAARRAVTDAEQLGFPPYKLAGTRALIALLDGDAEQAVRLARLAVASTDHGLARADDLATLARAHMATGDNHAARGALAEAEELAPWWPRVAGTRSRLDVV